MQKSNTLLTGEEGKVAPYFMQDPGQSDASQYERGGAIIPVQSYNDYVVILRDVLSSTIQLSTVEKLPSGIVVGIPPGSNVSIGDHVRFQDAMTTVKETEYPGYDKGSLTVVPEKYVLFRLP